MRTGPSLLAAAAAWLQLGACAVQAPTQAPRAGRPPRHQPGAHVASRRSAGPGARAVRVLETPENTGEIATRGQGFDAPDGLPVTHEQLAERYGRARALSVQEGHCSYYSDAFAGRPTASGAPYEPRGFTAAHLKLPFGSVLRVTRQDGGQSVYVRVTDRGPYGSRGRILDLSRAAAARLGMLRAGVVPIKIEVVEYGSPKPRRRH